MKCPRCGTWNRDAATRCARCGEIMPLTASQAGGQKPAWQDALTDMPKTYVRVEDGEAETGVDERDALAVEMSTLRRRKEIGERKQEKLRIEAARRGMAPSSQHVRTNTTRATFFDENDDPARTFQPMPESLVEEGEVREGARQVFSRRYAKPFRVDTDYDRAATAYPARAAGDDFRAMNDAPRATTGNYRAATGNRPMTGDTERHAAVRSSEPSYRGTIYDGYQDSSEFMPPQPRQDDIDNDLLARDMRRSAARGTGGRLARRSRLGDPDRFSQTTQHSRARKPGRNRVPRVLITAALLIVAGLATMLFLRNHQDAQARAQAASVSITPSILNDMAAHTVMIPGVDGQQIYVRELHSSYEVVNGYATIEIPDYTWYEEYDNYYQESMTVTLTPVLKTAAGKQTPLKPLTYEIDIPLSPIELLTPDSTYLTVSTVMYNMKLRVREGSTLKINDTDYSDLVNTEGGTVTYNASVLPIGDNVYTIKVRSQYCRENTLVVTLYREPQEIPLDLVSTLSTESSESAMQIRGTTLPGAIIRVQTPHTDLDITNTDIDGSFSFYAVFDHIGTNTITFTADYAGKKTTVINYNVYYVPGVNVYSRKCWAMDASHYEDLLTNIAVRAKNTQKYVCIGTVESVEFEKPQCVIMNCGTNAAPIKVFLENSTKTTWVEGKSYRIYADVFGTYNDIPRLVARYTYPN